MAKILGNWNMWFVQFLLIVAALIPDILLRAYKDMTTDVYVQRRCKQVSNYTQKRNDAFWLGGIDINSLPWY